MNLRNFVAASALSIFAVGPLTASDDVRADLHNWAKAAGAEISDVMIYPRIALAQGRTGTTSFKVTIDNEGEVLAYEAIEGKKIFMGASKRAIKRVDFPALPESFTSNQLAFKLVLEYQDSVDLQRAKSKQGQVTGSRIAFIYQDVLLGK